MVDCRYRKRLEFLADGIQAVVSGFGSVGIFYGRTWVPLTWEGLGTQRMRERVLTAVAGAGVPITTSGWVQRNTRKAAET